jgi:nucleoside-diphosphate-sugar epimerase
MRLVPLPRGGRRLLDLVHVSDVVEAVLAAIASPAAVGHAYNITDGESHSYRDILVAYGELTGRRPAVLAVPPCLFRLTLKLGLALQRGRRLTREASGRVAQAGALDLDVHYSIEAARSDLGYRPRVGLREGLRRTLLAAEPRA